jgi:hypothetical protein
MQIETDVLMRNLTRAQELLSDKLAKRARIIRVQRCDAEGDGDVLNALDIASSLELDFDRSAGGDGRGGRKAGYAGSG